MKRSSSATIWRGVRSASRARACWVRGEGMRLYGSQGAGTRDQEMDALLPGPCSLVRRLDDGDVRVRVHADLAGDHEAAAHDVGRREVGGLDEGARGGEGVGA